MKVPDTKSLTLDPEVLLPIVAEYANEEVVMRTRVLGSCVQATGAVLVVLHQLGFRRIAPLSVELKVVNAGLADLLEHGSSEAPVFDWAALGSPTEGPALFTKEGKLGWACHLVAVCEGRIVDPTTEQAVLYRVPGGRRSVVFRPPHEFLSLKKDEYVLHRPDSNGVGYAYRPLLQDNTFRSLPAWTDVALHKEVAGKILDRLWRDARVASVVDVSGLKRSMSL